jgi:hypothetical protein
MKEQFTFSGKKEIPRAFVVAAIKETLKHPRILQVPQVQRRLSEIEKTLADLRRRELSWHLDFNDAISTLRIEEPWAPAIQKVNTAKANLYKANTNKTLTCKWYPTQKCKYWSVKVRALNKTYQETLRNPWISLMQYKPIPAYRLNSSLTDFYESFKSLYNLTYHDRRINAMLDWIDSVEPLIMRILLRGDLWASCIEHVVHQDYRIREILDKAGLLEVRQVHARMYNVSVIHVDSKTVDPWFDEAAAFAWWLPDTIPAIVRRCATQTTGDCDRIGSVEIDSLQTKLSGNMARSVLIGLWNGLPMVLVIFALELVISCSTPSIRPSTSLTITS